MPTDVTSRGRPPAGRSAVDQEPHLLDQFAILYRYRAVFVSVFLLVVLTFFLSAYTATPLYQASARLAIDLEEPRTVATGSSLDGNAYPFWQDPKVYYETQYRIMTGTELAGRVVRRLDLTRDRQFRAGAGSLSESAVIGEFLSRLSAKPIPNSRLVDLTFISADAAFAAEAANAVAQAYVDQSFELRRQTVTGSLDWVSKELANQRAKVEASGQALAQYREDQKALSLSERQNIVVARLNQLNDAVTQATTNRLQKQALYEQIANLDGSAPESIPAVLQDPGVQASKTRVADLQRELAALLERYGEKYPTVVNVTTRLDEAMRQLQVDLGKSVEGIKNDYRSAQIEERTLVDALETQKSEAMTLDRKSVAYTLLERDAQSNRQVYEALLLREKELQVMANSRGNNVRITDPAQTPSEPFSPQLRQRVMQGLGAALAVSLLLVFFLDYLDDTVRNPSDVTDRLKVPLLGLAPKVATDGPLLVSEDVPYQFGEAFRALRTSLLFTSGSERTRVVMVTSAHPMEGKTTTACNLALALAMGGVRVLLIDADLRRPGVHRMLKIAKTAGLSEVLTGQATVETALVALDRPRLSVLTAGTPPPNPSELLGSDQMRVLIEQAQKGQFDWVIVDTPPVLTVTDGVVLAPLVSGVAFVIGSELTRRRHAALALETLRAGNPGHVGVVLNLVDFKRNRYSYDRYCGYKKIGYYEGEPRIA
jgi:capsular exopolysaccharide synthesis family protein